MFYCFKGETLRHVERLTCNDDKHRWLIVSLGSSGRTDVLSTVLRSEVWNGQCTTTYWVVRWFLQLTMNFSWGNNLLYHPSSYMYMLFIPYLCFNWQWISLGVTICSITLPVTWDCYPKRNSLSIEAKIWLTMKFGGVTICSATLSLDSINIYIYRYFAAFSCDLAIWEFSISR
jgi:hypothetical protein